MTTETDGKALLDDKEAFEAVFGPDLSKAIEEAWEEEERETERRCLSHSKK